MGVAVDETRENEPSLCVNGLAAEELNRIPLRDNGEGVSLDADEPSFHNCLVWVHREDGAVLNDEIHLFHNRSPDRASSPMICHLASAIDGFSKNARPGSRISPGQARRNPRVLQVYEKLEFQKSFWVS
jgi:hypothetical protein